MTGPSETDTALPRLNVLWPDAEFETLTASFDLAVVEVGESTGAAVQIRCFGYIGFERTGAWDEVVVESASLRDGGEFLNRCTEAIAAVSQAAGDSGSRDRNRRCRWPT